MNDQTYLDLENALDTRLAQTWEELSGSVYDQIAAMCRAGRWGAARALVQQLNMAQVGVENREYLRWTYLAFALWGAAKVKDEPSRFLRRTSWAPILDKIVRVTQAYFSHNATGIVRSQAMNLINRAEHGVQKTDVLSGTYPTQDSPARAHGDPYAVGILLKADAQGRYVMPHVDFTDQGSAQLQLISSLNSSRLATWGFTGEAESRGITRYIIAELMDGRCCDFCEMMNGKEFSVSDGRSLVTTALDAQDPNDLRTIQPWPSQDKKSMEDYRGMSEDDLVDEGLQIGPYHPHCYMVGTQVYTNRGFIDFRDVKIGQDMFWSLDPATRIPEWVKATKLFVFRHVGKMWSLENKGGDAQQIVTPDHTMFWSKRSGGSSKDRSQKLVFGPLSLFISGGAGSKLYCSSAWEGTNPEEVYFSYRTWPTELFLAFLGYYLSVGSVRHDWVAGNDTAQLTIQIEQSKYMDKMYADVHSLFPKARRVGSLLNGLLDTKISVPDQELGTSLSFLGHSHEKYVPPFVKDLSPKLICVFLDAFCLGDGSRREHFLGYASEDVLYHTSSLRLRDDLVELCIRAGYAPSIRLASKKGILVHHKNGVYAQTHDMWTVNRGTTKLKKCNQLQDFDYDGLVADVELEKHHTLLLNSNGRISWGSNCRFSMRIVQPSGDEQEVGGGEDQEPGELDDLLPQETSDDQSFSELGIDLDDKEIEKWNDQMGVSPASMFSAMTGDEPLQLIADDSPWKLGVAVDEDGQITSSMNGHNEDGMFVQASVTYDPDGKVLYLDSADFQGESVDDAASALNTLLNGLLDTAQSVEAKAVSISVGSDPVPYLKIGFVPDQQDWAASSGDILGDLQGGKLRPLYNALDQEQKDILISLLQSPDEQAAATIAQLDWVVDGKSVAESVLGDLSGEFTLGLEDKLAISGAEEMLDVD